MSVKPQSTRLTRQSIQELNKLFSQVSPKTLEKLLTKLYMMYFADDRSDTPGEFQRFYRPLFLLIVAMKRIEVRKEK